MAEEEKDENKTYLVKSNAELDLERRLDDDHVPESTTGTTVRVNPNPFGAENYVGTDPIYQNHANEVDEPLVSEDGAFKKVEEGYAELHNLDDVKDEEKAEDYGQGGVAVKAVTGTPERERYLVPGQEGYPEDPSKLVGPAVPVSMVKKDNDEEDDSTEGEVTTADNRGTNMGASTQSPTAEDSVGTTDDRGGNKVGESKDAGLLGGLRRNKE